MNYKTRELDKFKLDYQSLMVKYKKLSEKCENMQTELISYKSNRSDLMNDNFQSQKLLLNEKRNNSGFFYKYLKFIDIDLLKI